MQNVSVASARDARALTCSVRYKQQYGIETIVPACEVSQIFADISGHKTLTRFTIDAMKKLGIVFDVVQEQRSI